MIFESGLSSATILALLLSLTVVHYIIVTLYRVTIHPLAKYPGPLKYSVSSWPWALRIGTGVWHLELHELHQRYGDIVRWAPNGLSFRTTEALHDIYTDQDANLVKTGWTDANIGLNNGKFNIISCSDRKIHAGRRYILAQALTDNNLRKVEPLVLQCVRSLCDVVGSVPRQLEDRDQKEYWGGPLDMGHWSSMMTIDVLGELCFGKSFGALDRGSAHLKTLLMGAAKLTQKIAFLPIRHLLYPILTNPRFAKMFFGKTAASRVAYRNEVKAVVQGRLDAAHTADTREDFFHHLTKASNKETGACLTTEELVSESTALIAAGNDTASTCIASIFFYLLRSPLALTKTVSEITSTFTDVEEITCQRLKELLYLRAVIDESLRLSPPIPGLLTRRVLTGGALIDNIYCPTNTVIGVSAYALHHDEKFFPSASSFISERWIPGPHADIAIKTSPHTIDLAKSAFCAFSSGPRGCIGKNMAYMEIGLAIARLLFLYDIRAPLLDHTSPGTSVDANEYTLWDYFISDREGPFVEFKKR
ncbi:hypothetical protein Vi05172_g9370 [Venturia inaequalis]|uniref:Benzoate 4-monooxygenase cytochrome P450 n=1 Tax=Venturia inaequalis TaxID=5025 RepID=A0A8H3UKB1_VENIN|nr:hypothetical protein EG327_009780 [Venturia inaequalis]RDI80665.1 hypothetical protein Vi05172_g9370 [Venturia inaequalis]